MRSSEMLLPGEIEYRKEKERRSVGIPVPATLYEELVQLGKDMNLDAALSMEYCLKQLVDNTQSN